MGERKQHRERKLEDGRRKAEVGRGEMGWGQANMTSGSDKIAWGQVNMTDGSVVPVSRRKKEKILEIISNL